MSFTLGQIFYSRRNSNLGIKELSLRLFPIDDITENEKIKMNKLLAQAIDTIYTQPTLDEHTYEKTATANSSTSDDVSYCLVSLKELTKIKLSLEKFNEYLQLRRKASCSTNTRFKTFTYDSGKRPSTEWENQISLERFTSASIASANIVEQIYLNLFDIKHQEIKHFTTIKSLINATHSDEKNRLSTISKQQSIDDETKDREASTSSLNQILETNFKIEAEDLIDRQISIILIKIQNHVSNTNKQLSLFKRVCIAHRLVLLTVQNFWILKAASLEQRKKQIVQIICNLIFNPPTEQN